MQEAAQVATTMTTMRCRAMMEMALATSLVAIRPRVAAARTPSMYLVVSIMNVKQRQRATREAEPLMIALNAQHLKDNSNHLVKWVNLSISRTRQMHQKKKMTTIQRRNKIDMARPLLKRITSRA